jgi:hypothetical protein
VPVTIPETTPKRSFESRLVIVERSLGMIRWILVANLVLSAVILALLLNER